MTDKFPELKDFKPIDIPSLDLIKKYLKKYQFSTCDYNLSNLFAWSYFTGVKWNIYRDRIFFYNFNTGFMLYPLGEPFTSLELNQISKEIIDQGYSGNFISVPECYLSEHPDINKYYSAVKDENNSDYVYLSERLSELRGRKLQKKKNLVSQFNRLYPDSCIKTLSDKGARMCIELAEKWCIQHNEFCDDEKKKEIEVMKRALQNRRHTGLEGLMLFCGNDLVAFALFSEQKKDTATVHFEKFDYDYKGSAQKINRETAIYLQERYKYINREQDIGNEGLRKSKLSYDPEMIIPTYDLFKKKRS